MIPSAPGGQPDPRDPAGIEPATFSLEVHRPQQELHCSIVSLASRLRPLLPSLSQFASRAARIAALLPAATLVPARATDALPPLQTHRCIVRRYWTTHGGLGSRARSRHPAPKDPSPRGTTIDVIGGASWCTEPRSERLCLRQRRCACRLQRKHSTTPYILH